MSAYYSPMGCLVPSSPSARPSMYRCPHCLREALHDTCIHTTGRDCVVRASYEIQCARVRVGGGRERGRMSELFRVREYYEPEG